MSRLKELGGSRAAVRSVVFLSRHGSPRAAQRLARVIGRGITAARGGLYQAIVQNQAQVRGLRADDPMLPRAVQAVIEHAGQGYYHQFRAVALGEPALIQLDEQSRENLLEGRRLNRGVIAVGAHLSSFDLAIQHVTATEQIPALVLGLAEPTPGFQLLNAMRANPYCRVAPINRTALREAIVHLRSGGLVGTGVDRPVAGQMTAVEFFGRPALLPTGHIRLALRTNAVIVALWCEWSPTRGYRVRISPPIHVEQHPTVDETIAHNARRALSILETAIARRPEQWMMFIPVWPERHPEPAG